MPAKSGERQGGAQGRNRTTDTAIFSRMLYQLSYLGAVTDLAIRPCGTVSIKRPALPVQSLVTVFRS